MLLSVRIVGLIATAHCHLVVSPHLRIHVLLIELLRLINRLLLDIKICSALSVCRKAAAAGRLALPIGICILSALRLA